MIASRLSAWATLLTHPVRRFRPHRVIRAAQAFVQIEASSGIVLLLATLAALVWANSPWDDTYFDIWRAPLSIDLNIFRIEEDLQHAINDGLMTVFFFLVGLEIKRELVHGELSSVRRAILPATAALGGMVVPALIYTAFNAGGIGGKGWGIPMATDIAFALGVLSLASSRVPFSVKVFLLAMAMFDDLGSILVIAVFYSSQIDFEALALAGVVFATMVMMNRSGVRNVDVYFVAGAILWIATFESGISATLMGAALGLLTPASPFFDARSFAPTVDELVSRYRTALASGSPDEQQGILGQIEELSQGTESPLDRLERQLHPWVSYAIVPLFALANGGVSISSDAIGDALESPITQGILVARLLGKPLGILAFTWLAVRLGLGDLPAGAGWRHIVGVGLLGGIGFAVALLVTGFAFQHDPLIAEAKLGLLAASVLAGTIGFLFLWLVSGKPAKGDAGQS